MRPLVLAAALAAMTAPAVPAQLPPPQRAEPRRVAGPVIGGILAGGVGFLGGALIAGTIAERGIGSSGGCATDDVECLIWSILAGAEIGEAIMLPVGVHLGGGRRGNFPLELLASVAVGAAGLGMTALVNDPAPLVVVPILQVIVGTVIEVRR